MAHAGERHPRSERHAVNTLPTSFHNIWSVAASLPAYDKAKWTALSNRRDSGYLPEEACLAEARSLYVKQGGVLTPPPAPPDIVVLQDGRRVRIIRDDGERTQTATVIVSVQEGSDTARISIVYPDETIRFELSGAAVRALAAELPGPERVASVRSVK